MKAIGGYFELELYKGSEYHGKAIKLNSGRNAFEYILKTRSYLKIYLSYFTCQAILNTIEKLGLDYEFYNIDENFYPVFDFSNLSQNEALVFTNYFGINDKNVDRIVLESKNIIIDNAHSFFSKPLPGIDTFYSPRKFFGVPDGGYLYCDSQREIELELDQSFGRMEHLVKRIDLTAEDGFSDFLKNEELINSVSLKRMSNLTERILQSINYEEIALIRRNNFTLLNSALKEINGLSIELSKNEVPLSYPFLTDNQEYKKNLIEKRIYTPTYWPNVSNWAKKDTLEIVYSQNIIHLPIDQRLGENEMKTMLNFIL